jgi:hypothetical protein
MCILQDLGADLGTLFDDLDALTQQVGDHESRLVDLELGGRTPVPVIVDSTGEVVAYPYEQRSQANSPRPHLVLIEVEGLVGVAGLPFQAREIHDRFEPVDRRIFLWDNPDCEGQPFILTGPGTELRGFIVEERNTERLAVVTVGGLTRFFAADTSGMTTILWNENAQRDCLPFTAFTTDTMRATLISALPEITPPIQLALR